jgi:Kef-type K+ transport system membrane component KefB
MLIACALLVLLAAARLLGALFSRLRQPRVVGEIIAGLLLAPVIGAFGIPSDTAPAAFASFYWAGLLALMFFSGLEAKALLRSGENREVGIIAVAGTALPFALAAAAFAFVDLSPFLGRAASRPALVLVVGIAVAVTSIPVISRIFHDLGILQSRFARLVLSIAVLEDMVLWGFLAAATAIAKTGSAGGTFTAAVLEIVSNLLLFAFGLRVAPRLVDRAGNRSPLLAIALAVTLLAAAYLTGASLVFGAFLAGLVVARSNALAHGPGIRRLSRMAFSVLIPVYFAIVGSRIDLVRSFSIPMLVMFLGFACALKLVAVFAGSRLAGFENAAAWNLAIATNARGGPGIVLASVAWDYGIVSASFYTTLVLTAILTSQAAGAWLDHALRQGASLLREDMETEPAPVLPAKSAA